MSDIDWVKRGKMLTKQVESGELVEAGVALNYAKCLIRRYCKNKDAIMLGFSDCHEQPKLIAFAKRYQELTFR